MNVIDLMLEGKNIYLKVVSMDYLEDIFREFNESIITYMYPGPSTDIEETKKFVKSSIKKAEEGKDFTFMILKKDTDEFIGCGGVHHLDSDCPEFGIWVKKSAHGNHYGLDAIHICYAYFKDFYQKFIYPVDKRNFASKRIPLSLGGMLHNSYDELSLDGRKLFIEDYIIDVTK